MNTSASADQRQGVARIGRFAAIGMALGILAFGLYCEDWRSWPWATITAVVFSLPLAMQWLHSSAWRAYGLWFGLFIVAQSLLTPLIRGDHVALPARMQTVVEVTTDAIPGYPAGTRQVTTDDRGWRVKPAVDYGLKSGLRVIAIGGSTTEDIMLDDAATWTHRLQESLRTDHPGIQVINTGVSGLRAANHVAALQVADTLQPDLVLILLGGNDWNKHIKDHHEPGWDRRQPLPFRSTALPRVLDSLLIAPLRQRWGGGSTAKATLRITRPQDLNGSRGMYADRSEHRRFEPAAVSEGYAADLRRLGALCEARKRPCIFITQPHAYGPPAPASALQARLWMTPPYASYGLDLQSMSHVARLYNAHLASFARAAGHPLCDAAAGMPVDQRLFYDDMHYTDEGAARMAQLIAPCVREALKNTVRAAPTK